jgi:hypothetical protein
MAAVLIFVCLVTLIKEITHVPVTMGHNFIKMDMTAWVRQLLYCDSECIHAIHDIIMLMIYRRHGNSYSSNSR